MTASFCILSNLSFALILLFNATAPGHRTANTSLYRKTWQQMEHQKYHIRLDQDFIYYLKYCFTYSKDFKILFNMKPQLQLFALVLQ
jgi:hypothetical protein